MSDPRSLLHLSDTQRLEDAAKVLHDAADRLERAAGASERDKARIVGNAEFCIDQARHLLAEWRAT